MQMEKTLANDHLRVSKVPRKLRIPTIIILVSFTREICYFLKVAYFLTVSFCLFCLY